MRSPGFLCPVPREAAMPTGIRVASHIRDRLLVLSAAALLVFVTLAIPASGRAVQDVDGGAERARVRIVHGIADAGPLDFYVDGSLALVGMIFAHASGDVVLRGGEHTITVVPAGSSPETAIATGTIALGNDTRAYVALLGTLDSASVELFEVDIRPVDQGSARFRIINGVPDVEEITPVFSGGDALSEPLSFAEASQYASIDAGTYDLDMLETGSGASLLALPQTPFAEGTTIDLFLVGQVSDGSLTAVVAPITAEVARAVGQSAQIFTGSCAELGAVAANLGIVRAGQGAVVGAGGTDPVAQGFGTAGISFTTLVETPHAVAVSEDAESGGEIMACGDIAGALTDTGALVLALRTEGTEVVSGVAVLAPALDDPEATGVSVFLVAEVPTAGAAATPVNGVES
jgi:hypothetical protein